MPPSDPKMNAMLELLSGANFAADFRASRVVQRENFLDVESYWTEEIFLNWLATQCDYTKANVFIRMEAPPYSMKVNGVDAVYAALKKGQSVQVIDIHRLLGPNDPLIAFFNALESHVGFDLLSLAMVLTPPGQRAIRVHNDQTDVFTLQISGEKRWDVWETDDVALACKTPPEHSIHLKAGSMLYIPATRPHYVLAGDTPSLSVGYAFKDRSSRRLVHRLLEKSHARLLDRTLPTEPGELATLLRSVGTALLEQSEAEVQSTAEALRTRRKKGKPA